ncbi:hypothetical protein WA026_005450, partial [Henosepilachna vigintioctopunctata]
YNLSSCGTFSADTARHTIQKKRRSNFLKFEFRSRELISNLCNWCKTALVNLRRFLHDLTLTNRALDNSCSFDNKPSGLGYKRQSYKTYNQHLVVSTEIQLHDSTPSEVFEISTGVTQGSILSLMQFNVHEGGFFNLQYDDGTRT